MSQNQSDWSEIEGKVISHICLKTLLKASSYLLHSYSVCQTLFTQSVNGCGFYYIPFVTVKTAH